MPIHTLKPFLQQLLTRHKYYSRGNDMFGWAGADVMVHLPYLVDRQPEKNASYGPTYVGFSFRTLSWGFL